MQLEIKLKKENDKFTLANQLADVLINEEVNNAISTLNSKLPGFENVTFTQAVNLLIEVLCSKYFGDKNLRITTDTTEKELTLTINNI